LRSDVGGYDKEKVRGKSGSNHPGASVGLSVRVIGHLIDGNG